MKPIKATNYCKLKQFYTAIKFITKLKITQNNTDKMFIM